MMLYGVTRQEWVKRQDHFYSYSLIVCVLNWLEETWNIFAFSIISQHWDCAVLIVASFLGIRQGGPIYLTWTILWLLLTWGHKESGLRYYPNSLRIYIGTKYSKISIKCAVKFLIEIIKFSIKNALKNTICTMAVTLFRSKCVKWQGLM